MIALGHYLNKYHGPSALNPCSRLCKKPAEVRSTGSVKGFNVIEQPTWFAGGIRYGSLEACMVRGAGNTTT